MDTTIRNLDREAYRALKARAALEGVTIGELVNRAIRSYLAQPGPMPKSGTLRSLRPEQYPEGNEGLSEEIDVVVYGS
jgi:plasmid stability protein